MIGRYYNLADLAVEKEEDFHMLAFRTICFYVVSFFHFLAPNGVDRNHWKFDSRMFVLLFPILNLTQRGGSLIFGERLEARKYLEVFFLDVLRKSYIRTPTYSNLSLLSEFWEKLKQKLFIKEFWIMKFLESAVGTHENDLETRKLELCM